MKTNKNLHNKAIYNIENFSNFIREKRNYTKERIDIIEQTKKEESFTKLDKNSFLLKDYNLHLDLLKKFNYKSERLTTKYKPEILKLENIRQKLTNISKELFIIDTTIDKGESWGATKVQIEKAYKDFDCINAKYNEEEKKICELINLYNNNNIIKDWIFAHLITCISIIDFAYTKNVADINKDSTRLYVADETFYLWLNISNSTKKYIIPNTYYLNDYDKFINNIIN